MKTPFYGSAAESSLDTQVLIVGSGISGLILACDLLRRNIEFRIIDPSRRPAVWSGGMVLQPRSLEILDDLGIIEEVLARGVFHKPFRIYSEGQCVKEVDPVADHRPSPQSPFDSNFWIPQVAVEALLRDRLDKSGIQTEWGTQLKDSSQDVYGISATLEKAGHPETLYCRYLIDTLSSESDEDLDYLVEISTEQRQVVAHLDLEGLDHSCVHTWPDHPDGVISLCPLEDSTTFQLKAQVAPDFHLVPDLEAFGLFITQRTGSAAIRLKKLHWVSIRRGINQASEHYRMGRIFLVGDAAHQLASDDLQANLGLQDAYNLGWKLALVISGLAGDHLLNTYESERLPVARTFLTNQSTADCFLKEPQCHYRQSAISYSNEGDALSLQAGDRAPDAPMREKNGQPVWLFELFRGTHFTVLHADISDLPEQFYFLQRKNHIRSYAIGELLVDDSGHYRAAYGDVQDMLYVIRPDGYIGYIGYAKAYDPLMNYFNQYFRVQSVAW